MSEKGLGSMQSFWRGRVAIICVNGSEAMGEHILVNRFMIA
jgi:hypothetical protein